MRHDLEGMCSASSCRQMWSPLQFPQINQEMALAASGSKWIIQSRKHDEKEKVKNRDPPSTLVGHVTIASKLRKEGQKNMQDITKQ